MAQIQATGVSHSLNLTSIMPVPSRQSFCPRHGMPPEGVDGAVLHAVEALLRGHNHLPVLNDHLVMMGGYRLNKAVSYFQTSTLNTSGMRKRKQMVTTASATWLTSTAPPPTGFLPSHPLTRYVLSSVFVSASRWSRGPELLTARSALACVPVPRGEFL